MGRGMGLPQMPTVKVIGQDTLAEATQVCAYEYFRWSDDPDILWVCYDTPIGWDDKPDVEWVVESIGAHLPANPEKTLILVSSQVKVGTTKLLEERYPGYHFAHSPENIRVATAVEDFKNQARVVVGRRDKRWDDMLRQLFAPFTDTLLLTDPETAEMVKHALNVWLGMNIAYMNEIAHISRLVGADPAVVSKALLTERRISPHAPLKPGKPFGGGHLARDIYNLNEIAGLLRVQAPIIAAIKPSNDQIRPL